MSTSNHVPEVAGADLNLRWAAVLSMLDKALKSVDQPTRLNINPARATLEQSNIAARQFIAAEGLHEFLSLWAAQLQPDARRLFDYGYYLSTILAAAQVELMKIASGGIADLDRDMISLMGNTRSNVPGFKAAAGYRSEVIDSAAAEHPQARHRTIRIERGQSSDGHINIARGRPAHAAKQADSDAGKE